MHMQLRKIVIWPCATLKKIGRCLMGEDFSIADAYLFALTGWGKATWMKSVYNANIDFSSHRHLQSWYERVKHRPSVQRVLSTEVSGDNYFCRRCS